MPLVEMKFKLRYIYDYGFQKQSPIPKLFFCKNKKKPLNGMEQVVRQLGLVIGDSKWGSNRLNVGLNSKTPTSEHSAKVSSH